MTSVETSLGLKLFPSYEYLWPLGTDSKVICKCRRNSYKLVYFAMVLIPENLGA